MSVSALVNRLKPYVNRDRLVNTVTDLVAIPSPTGNAGQVLNRIGELLQQDGFDVERPTGGHAVAPAVAVRYASGQSGRVMQFNGHVDTVHLPFIPPAVDGDLIRGSGSCDMKGGTAAAIEALRILKESGALDAGSVLFTAHDLHEAPWGFGQQLDQLIREGYVGDAVLIPEYQTSCITIAGRGSSTWKARIRRAGPPIHEVMRPPEEPSVIEAGAELVVRLRNLSQILAQRVDPVAGCETVFIGQIHSGEIFNQYPQECWLEGTRRWLPGRNRDEVEAEFRQLVQLVAQRTRTTIDLEFQFIRDPFALDLNDPLVSIFQEAYTSTAPGRPPLPYGPKLFVDDGNSFWGIADVAAITHGPQAGGAHTVDEWVSISDLERVALLYAVAAVTYCRGT